MRVVDTDDELPDIRSRNPLTIHIAPLGFEKERIYYPAIKQRKAHGVILLVPHDDDQLGEECLEEVKTRLDDSDVEVWEVECDIFDYEASLSLIQRLINLNNEHRVEVNLATGSKMTAIAGLLACIGTDAQPFYVHGENYPEQICNAKREEPEPVIPPEIRGTSKEEYLILKHIYEEDGATAQEIAEYYKDSEEVGNKDTIVKRLKEPERVNLVERKDAGREKPYFLTERGERFMEFESLRQG